MDATKIAEQFLEETRELLGGLPQEGEEPVPGPVEIKVGSQWTAVGAPVFRAWTGQRRIWGIEYHGPVYVMGAKEETLFTGKRICPCAECQKSVVPEFKYN